jgi:glyoxylase-like metal-dependent hydrolase (beta-lactamase superfamily II)
MTASDLREIADEVPGIAAELDEVELDPPDRTVDDGGADLDIGGRRLELRWLGRGHTDDDLVVRIPDASVLFAGDLLENGATPYFGDGYPIDWPATATALRSLVDGSVVPGHGDVADLRFVDESIRAFERIATLAGRIHRGDLDLAAAIAAAPYPADDAAEPLERALAQLRGELD